VTCRDTVGGGNEMLPCGLGAERRTPLSAVHRLMIYRCTFKS